MTCIIKRGDIFYADLSPVIGSEMGGIRPVIILQNDAANMHSPTVIVATITSQINKAKLPTHIEISSKEYGLPKDSVALFEHIKTIDKVRLKEKVGEIPKPLLHIVDNALCIAFDIKAIENIKQSENIDTSYIQQIQKLEKYIYELTKPLVITEGKTDVRIIKVAWLKLFPNREMPFECKASGIEPNENEIQGSAETVRREVEFMSAITARPIIGIFDNDAEGNKQFSGLNKKIFEKYNIEKNIRKHNNKNVWGMLLPVPVERKSFITNNDITQRYFVIEHYFSDDVLKRHSMYGNNILGTSVFKVNNRKDEFSKEINNIEATEFKNFNILFSKIEEIINKL